MNINEFLDFADDINNLQRNFNRALNCIVALRREKAAILNAVNNNNIESVHKFCIAEKFDKQLEDLNNPDFVIDEISHYSDEWFDKKKK